MSSMASNGITWFPDPTLENFVRDAARLPKLTEDEEERRRQMQMRTEATQFAQANMAYIQSKQQLIQTAMGEMQQNPNQEGQPQQQEQ